MQIRKIKFRCLLNSFGIKFRGFLHCYLCSNWKLNTTVTRKSRKSRVFFTIDEEAHNIRWPRVSDCTSKLPGASSGLAWGRGTLHSCKVPHFLNPTGRKAQNSFWRSSGEEYTGAESYLKRPRKTAKHSYECEVSYFGDDCS